MQFKLILKRAFIFIGISILSSIISLSVIFLVLKNNSSIFELILNSSRSVTEKKVQNNNFITDSVVEAVKKANPAVVAITISKNVPVYEKYYENYPNPFDNFFEGDFFGGFSVPKLRQNGVEKKEVGGGSGFLVSSDGFIVTNRHVVSDENAEYAVFLNDGKKYDAKVVARDQSLDLAVIKISGIDLPYLEFGDSDQINLGETVIAIGNALAEFRNTVSVGVVSGLARSIVASDRKGQSEVLDQLIQTDAAINPGNSGGPLLNIKGQVIAVNVAVAGGAENIGFALSSNSVKNIIESVKKTGKISRPFVGVRYININKDIQQKNNLDFDYGVLVQRGSNSADLAVIPGSPADKVGILENDIILEVDGVKINEKNTLPSLIRNRKIGEQISLKIFSKGKEKNVKITLEEMSK